MTHSEIQTQTGIDVVAVARLNDALRVTGLGGHTLLTTGVSALEATELAAVLRAVAAFAAFDERNDPYGEHDCAIVIVDGLQVMWKIDYYDLDLSGHSGDPANADITRRVLTIMLAEEY
jgi:hypothetical protein